MANSPLDRLKAQLLTSGIQQENIALFQVISQLIDYLRTNITSTQSVIGGSGGGGLLGASYLTKAKEITLPNSLQEIAGSGIQFNDTQGRRTISAALPFAIDGSDGIDGEIGPQGLIGPIGLRGIDGIHGLEGEDGIDGLSIPGSIGPQGIQGKDGLSVPGFDADESEPVMMIPGPIGPIGNQGIQGIPGFDGIDGENENPFFIPDLNIFALNSSLAAHAALTTTAHGLGASAFHADSFFSPAAGSSSIITVGTITTGIWNAGAVTSSGKVIGASGYFTGTFGIGIDAPADIKLEIVSALTEGLVVICNKATGSVYGIDIGLAGAATNNYGFFLDAVNATNNYALYCYRGDAVFGAVSGRVGIGVIPVASKFAIVGLPISAVGLATGDIWVDTTGGLNILKIV